MWIEYYFNSNSNQAGTDVALDTSSLYWKETKYNLDSFRGKLYFRHLNRSEAFVAQEYSVRASRIL